jgi:hypothetical protein
MVTDRPTNVEQVTCETCLMAVPLSEWTISAPDGYVLYLCGLDCRERWKALREARSWREECLFDQTRVPRRGAPAP